MHVTLTILRSPNRLHFTLTGHSNRLAGENSPSQASVDSVSLAATLDVDEARYTQLQKQIKAAVQTLNIADAADQHAEMATPEAAANALTEFESLGRVLFTQAVPPVIQQQIRLLPSASLLEIVSNDLNFPWELLHDGQGFLCVRLCVTRLPLLDQPPKQHILPSAKSKVSCLLLGNPTADLTAAEEEIHTIEDLLYSVHDRVHYDSYFGKMVTSSLLQELLASQKYDLVHIACHARPGELLLADGWMDVNQLCAGLQNHPIIVLNACSSIQALQSTDEPSALTQNLRSFGTALIQSGASAVIGMMWPIPDLAIRHWCKAFYGQLIMGTPIAEALRTSRLRFSQLPSMAASGLAPVLYGNPLEQLVPNALKRGAGTLLLLRFHHELFDQRQGRVVEADSTAKSTFDPLRTGGTPRRDDLLCKLRGIAGCLWALSIVG